MQRQLQHQQQVASAPAAVSVLANNESAVADISKSMNVVMSSDRFIVDDVDVTDIIRGPQVTEAVSTVAALSAVRSELRASLRTWVDNAGGGVVEGRDIGTTVWPDAELKIFLTADVAARAARRQAQLSELSDVSASSVADSLAKRDAIDSMRAASPLRQSEDQIVLDATYLNLEETIQALWNLIEERKLNG